MADQAPADVQSTACYFNTNRDNIQNRAHPVLQDQNYECFSVQRSNQGCHRPALDRQIQDRQKTERQTMGRQTINSQNTDSRHTCTQQPLNYIPSFQQVDKSTRETLPHVIINIPEDAWWDNEREIR